jgi:hypothetical protein
MCALMGCGVSRLWNTTVPDSTVTATNALDDAIDAISNTSSDWQQTLTDLQQKLIDQGKATIRDEVAVLASRSIAQAGVEFRCNADFVRDRVIQGLLRIKSFVLNGSAPPIEPALCQVVPIAVDRAAVPADVKQLEFYGYDFDHATGLTVTLERTTGGPVDVTAHIARPTHYAMTLRFGAGGVQLDGRSSRFRLDWNGQTISTIDVIQPQTPVCQSKVVHVSPGAVTYEPPQKGSGDADFDGNGPNITTTVTLHMQPKRLSAELYMKAKETESDWTRAEGTKTFELYKPDPGWRIDAINGDTKFTHSYTDDDHSLDNYNFGAGGPITRLVYRGDDDGADAGAGTHVLATFNRIALVLVQDADCVSDRAVFTLAPDTLRRIISPATFLRLRPLAIQQRDLRLPMLQHP